MARGGKPRYLEVFASLLFVLGLLPLLAISAVPDYVKDHAPIIWLHSNDSFMPSDIPSHAQHTKAFKRFKPLADSPVLDFNNLSSLNQYGKDIYLTAVENITTMPEWLFGETPDVTGALHNSTACAVVLIERKDQIVDAFYFYFYSFDEGADITQVLPPLNKILPDSKPGDHFGNHVGDWEHNMVRFKDGVPVGIWYSQHAWGEACLWNDEACLSKQGDRPVVYSARGSHANYPSAGSHVHDAALIDVADKGRLWDPIQPAWFYTYDPSTDNLTALEPETAPTDWFSFLGGWGDQQYPDDDPRQQTVPYFGLKKYNSGPNGPRFKHLLRKDLMPDEKPKPTLMGTLVRIYMSWYGCCLRGINPWVVVISILLFLAVTTFLAVFTVRRLTPVGKRWLTRARKGKHASGIGSAKGLGTKVTDWFTRRKRRQEHSSEYSMGLLDPREGEDEV
ncbi:hypothetical protein LTR10_018962 [Elasticomyces elasticus]|uniref:Vacuolar protein sorting-associated protein 62 n=1 Tax=Exophiala sideris TaxID=1016849 RepID=A0ABR0IXW0_9EURO|nr:hypothetical protein LTR10_018962 [Elasticomyces elasticus]KAK5022284.1 hypothetical protein LTS07_010160 [Exophiala sideris]KAK5027096.1 hypothetical protein LTR13_009706 [Exophiala sideris]KAK5051671.1 hypothetical protein LTR69_010171 [Exophiala sideris]KAK5177636.1 hypothetical protein LTR44_009826 [Eurotiomycetes sp. CCFEE 6388]